MHLADGDQPLEHVRLTVGIGLVQHALVPVAGGAGLVAVNAGDDEDRVLHPLLQCPEPRRVLQHGVLPVGGAGADEQHQPLILPGDDGAYLPVVFLLLPRQLLRDGVHVLDGLWGGQLTFEFHVHG